MAAVANVKIKITMGDNSFEVFPLQIISYRCRAAILRFDLTQLYRPMTALTNAHVEFATSLVNFERVFEVLDIPVEIHDRITKSGDQVTSYRNTSQQGDHEQRPVLRENNFEIQPGQLTALVGPSGAGKMTITYLVPRLYDPIEGRVILDGIDLRDIQLDFLSRYIGMVTQETYLFHDTIRTNLLYAKPEAMQEELEDACRTANIHDFISNLPDGYDTIVGERGYRLSGGEKQRVAIARVVLKDPRVLILDEATSHLDSESEALIQHALERVMVGRTSLVIAHRLSTILSAQGRVVQRGAHDALLAQGGLYRDLYERQFQVSAEKS